MNSILYGKLDPRDVAAYSVKEAAQMVAIPVSTARAWAVGQSYESRGRRIKFNPLLPIAESSPPTLSFWNVVEVYVLGKITRQHGVRLPKVRTALEYVQTKLGIERPLIHQEFRTDGVDLFIEQYSRLINASDNSRGQLALRGMLEHALARIKRDDLGLAISLAPFRHSPKEPQFVEINPRRAFGRLVIKNTSVPTSVLKQRFLAGESIDSLAGDYGLTRDQIEAAIRWETGVAA